MTLATWNVRTILGPFANEQARNNIDIPALSETRLAAEGELCKRGIVYSISWSGRAPEERCKAGVGFAVRATPLASWLDREKEKCTIDL